MRLVLVGVCDERGCSFVLEDRHTLEWACEWHLQGKKASYLTGQPLWRKEPKHCDGRLLRILGNDAEQFRLKENCKTPFIVGC